MDSLRLSKDKYGRTLAILNVNADTTMDDVTTDYYMAVVIVDTRNNNAREYFEHLAHRLSDDKVFTIAVFATGCYDWTFDNALMFGVNAWFVIHSLEEAECIAIDIERIVTSENQISLDLADLKTILFKSDGQRAYFGTGLCKDNNLKTALYNAFHKAQERGMNVYECSKYLIAISTTSDLTKEQMSDLNDFINNLSEKHSGYFEIKWGLAHLTDTEGDTIKVILIASH